ncbi:hypothetical protein HDU87_005725 [Geranomyces variabilis]|uniref:Dynamin-type G domain-containing protein n=1 Tax=Geranomyces variabilis TaxID=109894 RepID=A0AAD5TI74_9FUNG|nr:hypothetical protein HDU87_005725 [Geranomyces variabilis]
MLGGTLNNDHVRELLDKNDKVRAVVGGTDFQKLVPSIVVVGAQSHGKSSVLEAAAEVKLPAGTGMVTKSHGSAIEYVPLCQNLSAHSSCSFAVRPKDLQERLLSKAPVAKNEKPIRISAKAISKTVSEDTKRTDGEQAKAGNPTGIVNQPMTIRIEKSDLPDVTLIDLPGIKYDDKTAEERIKALIREYIEPPSAIILVVHNATVHTDTNEGFKMAREVDKHGQRTLCVLTHVDLIRDPVMMQSNVLDLLAGTASPPVKYIAVVNPASSVHDTISHADARQLEREYFATMALIPQSKYGQVTGTTALLSHIQDMYSIAVQKSQGPLQVQRSLDNLPEAVSPHARFSQIWQQTASAVDELVYDGVVKQIHDKCERLSEKLLKVPMAVVKGTVGKRHPNLQMGRLVEVLVRHTGSILPNFMPFPPLNAFISGVIQVYASQTVKEMEMLVQKALDDVQAKVQVKLDDQMAGNPYTDCNELTLAEVTRVFDLAVNDISQRLTDIVIDEGASIWTCDIKSYTATLDYIAASSGDTERPLMNVFDNDQDIAALFNGSETLKAQTRTYICSFYAYWTNLKKQKEELEAAHKILDGRLPPLPAYKVEQKVNAGNSRTRRTRALRNWTRLTKKATLFLDVRLADRSPLRGSCLRSFM